MSLNRVVIMGRLTRDPELRYTQSQVPVASFRLAVDRDFGGRDGSERQTDFIFSVCGEELGFLGCALIIVLLLAIVVRCLLVARDAATPMESYVCVGMAGMLIFQTIANIGMCLFLMPVIGLTLPFISYGGSSLVTMYLAMGVVSGIHMRPQPDSENRYISPRYE